MFKDEEEVIAKDTTSTDENDSVVTTATNGNTAVSEQVSQDSERSMDIVRRSSHPFKSRRMSKSRYIRKQSNTSLRSFGTSSSVERGMTLESRLSSTQEHESDDDSMHSTRPEWAFDQIAMSEDSDSEFFDARGECV